jgi:hypothetical protein
VKRLLGFAAVIAVVLLVETDGWGQCAMCRTALENSAEGQAVAQGFREGIVFLLAVPYAILGSIAFGLVRAFKRREQE